MSVLPVIIGDAVPRSDADASSGTNFARYMLLLFKPWRSFVDLKNADETWSEAYERTAFSPYCKKLIGNMMVDSECRDTKCEQMTAFLASLPQGVGGSNAEGAITIDGDPLSHILAQDDTIMDCEEVMATVEDIHAKFSLDQNKEQSRAFRIAAEHFAFNTMKQMLLFIMGIGGSGKSHVIKAIIALFKRCGCPQNLLLSTPTGSAAVLIDGYTIHALTFLPGGDIK